MLRALRWIAPLVVLLVVMAFIAAGSVVATHAAGIPVPPVHPNTYWPG